VIRTILVPLDGSPFGEQALQHAQLLAVRHDAALHLVHVHVELMPQGATALAPDWDQRRRLGAQHYLESVAAQVGRDGVPAVARLLEGPFRAAMIHYIESQAVDLVVMSTHGRGGISRAWLGGMADTLIRASRVPVLLVRPHDDEAGAQALPSAAHALVALDGSSFAEAALDSALEIAGAEGRITLLQVLPPAHVVGAPFDESGWMHDPDVQQAQEERCGAYMQGIVQRLEGRTGDVRALVRTHPQPAVVIARVAETEGADFIAIATHGRGSALRTLLGSVADKVVRTADVPVLVVRPAAVAVPRAAPAAAEEVTLV
jgi:nucleotide-binding universal stress UspA family protein